MANTYVKYTLLYNSNVSEYIITFPFLKNEHIKVVSIDSGDDAQNTIRNWTQVEEPIDNSEGSLPLLSYYIKYENGQNKIKFTSFAGVPEIVANRQLLITIFRRTAFSEYLYFSNGSTLESKNLNELALLALYTSQEAIEALDLIDTTNQVFQSVANKYNISGGTLYGLVNATQGITTTNLSVSGQITSPTQIILNGGTLKNVPTPTANTDAVNKAYVDALTIAGSPQNVTAGSITANELAYKTITSNKMADNSILNENLSGLCVTESKIADGAVTTDKIGTNQVNSTKLSSNSVTNIKLASNAVTTAKIANGAVTSAKLAINDISGSSLLDSSVPSTKIKNFPIIYNNEVANPTDKSLYIYANTIDAPNAVCKFANITECIQLNEYYTTLVNGSNELVLGLKAVAPFNSGFTANDLYKFHGKPVVFDILNTDPTPFKNGHYNFSIRVKSTPFIKEDLLSIFALRRPPLVGGDNGVGSATGNTLPLAKNTISNIPFNSTIRNDNPSISLNTATGEIIFDNQLNSTPRRYLITLSGSCFFTNANGSRMTIIPVTDYTGQLFSSNYYPEDSPFSSPETLIQLNPSYPADFKFFSQSVFNLQGGQTGGNTITKACKYYYYYPLNNANESYWGIQSGTFSTLLSGALPSAWNSQWGYTTNNAPIVQITIHSIPV